MKTERCGALFETPFKRWVYDYGSIQDVFGEDIDIYRAVDSVTKALRPQ